jgi:hypothetical protein
MYMKSIYAFLGAALSVAVLVSTATGVTYLNSGGLYTDSSGKVGIGTSSPSEVLDVIGNIRASGNITAGPSDNFDSYSDGDLNGSNAGIGFGAAWSGSTSFDVQSTVSFKGAKTIKVSQAAGQEPVISRTFSSKTDGILHWAQRKDGTDHNQGVDLLSGSTLAAHVFMAESPGGPLGQVWGVRHGGSGVSLGVAYATSTWYTVDLEFNTNTDKYRVSINGGAFSEWKDFANAVSSIDKVQIETGAGGSSTVDGYWDDIRFIE